MSWKICQTRWKLDCEQRLLQLTCGLQGVGYWDGWNGDALLSPNSQGDQDSANMFAGSAAFHEIRASAGYNTIEPHTDGVDNRVHRAMQCTRRVHCKCKADVSGKHLWRAQLVP